jgi:hypothetical protein
VLAAGSEYLSWLRRLPTPVSTTGSGLHINTTRGLKIMVQFANPSRIAIIADIHGNSLALDANESGFRVSFN